MQLGGTTGDQLLVLTSKDPESLWGLLRFENNIIENKSQLMFTGSFRFVNGRLLVPVHLIGIFALPVLNLIPKAFAYLALALVYKFKIRGGGWLWLESGRGLLLEVLG